MSADEGLEGGLVAAVKEVREQLRVSPLAEAGRLDGCPDKLHCGFASRAHDRGSGGRIIRGKDAAGQAPDTLIFAARGREFHRARMVKVARLFS